MVLGAFLGITLGMYGAYKIAKEPIQFHYENQIKEQRSNVDIDVICKYMQIKKIDGVYPSHKINFIEKTLINKFYFKDYEVDKIKEKYLNKINQQKNQYQNHVSNKYQEAFNDYKRYQNISERYHDKNEYFEVRHWFGLNKKEHEERINKIYHDELWQQLCIEPPRLIPIDKFNNSYKEVWYIKKNVWDNPQKYYNAVCEKLGYTTY